MKIVGLAGLQCTFTLYNISFILFFLALKTVGYYFSLCYFFSFNSCIHSLTFN